MVWFKVDDNLAFHPKVVEAGNGAIGLWVRAGAWSSANLTDGFIPTRIARQLGTKIMCYRLVSVGLFEERADGFQFHDWDHQQLTKLEVEAKRQYERVRKADQRKRQLMAVPSPQESDESPDGSPDESPHGAPAGTTTESPNVISHPVPSPTSSYVGRASPVGSDIIPETANAAPPQFCIDHPGGTPHPCGACGSYRKHYESWLRRQDIEAKQAVQARARADMAARQAMADACILCDADSYRPNFTVCDHTDHTETNRAGMAMARAALTKKPQSL